MPTSVKIIIVDNIHLRNEIDELYEQMDHVEVAKWSLLVANAIKTINLLSDNDIEAIIEERKWQLKTLRNIKDKIESL